MDGSNGPRCAKIGGATGTFGRLKRRGSEFCNPDAARSRADVPKSGEGHVDAGCSRIVRLEHDLASACFYCKIRHNVPKDFGRMFRKWKPKWHIFAPNRTHRGRKVGPIRSYLPRSEQDECGNSVTPSNPRCSKTRPTTSRKRMFPSRKISTSSCSKTRNLLQNQEEMCYITGS
jgi:hypothetical protein